MSAPSSLITVTSAMSSEGPIMTTSIDRIVREVTEGRFFND